MNVKFLCCSLILVASNVLGIKSEDVDYYWREYEGAIPEDAFPAGRDTNDKNIYIGQVYINDKGLYIGRILPGTREVEVSAYGYRIANKVIKILCTKHQNNFIWMKTSRSTFEEDTPNKLLVVGGYDQVNDKTLYVGRTMQEGILKVGNVSPYRPYLWFGEEYQNVKAPNYEILVYNSNNSNEIDKVA